MTLATLPVKVNALVPTTTPWYEIVTVVVEAVVTDGATVKATVFPAFRTASVVDVPADALDVAEPAEPSAT